MACSTECTECRRWFIQQWSSRIKTLAALDIAEKRRPQDGRFKTTFNQTEVELRVSTAPTAFGEKLVARVFDPGVLMQSVEQLGFFPRNSSI